MSLRRALLSLALIGSCIWCLGLVRQVNAEKSTSTPENVRVVDSRAPAADVDH
jgi:hypothetical protein